MHMYLNIERLREIVPPWAADVSVIGPEMNGYLQEWLGGSPVEPHGELGFWFDCVGGRLRLATPSNDGVNLDGQLIIEGIRNPLGSPCQVVVPLNTAVTGYQMPGTHSLYVHGIQTETALYYFGITKQRWYARLSQHVAGARSGSPFVFHRALAQHAGKFMTHRLIDPALPFEYAMEKEEEFIDAVSLYPKGMNMIPGGFAGLRYLASLGVNASSLKQRDAAIERLSRLPTIKGKPNPLCAARWQSDQDYVNRIICGHGDRLSVEQVRQIRLLSGFGLGPNDIAARIGSRNERQVRNVVTGRRYGRVA